ncbi:MspA family porin [Mycobacterium sp. 1274761.0]|uniref:MspA family porin n=1 Tax=Mycobacterium sp. 1274761.0 TaxID=1834077 RepID=UPI0007FF9970|nr:MspA family porin [Mycobacterium sp. 1274761.0]OBK78674.1 MspA protein [Mycobacterium sp. 1274761.0]
MLNRFATVAAVCMLVPVGPAAVALADDPPPAVPAADAVGPPPDNGVVPSGPPGVAHASEGRTITVLAKDETQLPIAPLTTSLASRDWLVGATFTGSGMGSAKGGSLEVGYQIGCAIEMDKIKLNGSIGIGTSAFGLNTAGVLGGPTSLTVPIQGQIEVEPRPGTVTNVVVDKKTYKGNSVRVTVKDIHIKIDNCVGASSLRSYAILTSSNGDTDDVVAYYGVTKVF